MTPRNELYHYRTPGSVNGVRRYQNEDGSLTPLGRIHYGIGEARDSASKWITDAGNNAGNWFKNLGNNASNWLKTTGNNVSNWTKTAGNDASNWLRDTGNNVSNWARDTGNYITGNQARSDLNEAQRNEYLAREHMNNMNELHNYELRNTEEGQRRLNQAKEDYANAYGPYKRTQLADKNNELRDQAQSEYDRLKQEVARASMAYQMSSGVGPDSGAKKEEQRRNLELLNAQLAGAEQRLNRLSANASRAENMAKDSEQATENYKRAVDNLHDKYRSSSVDQYYLDKTRAKVSNASNNYRDAVTTRQFRENQYGNTLPGQLQTAYNNVSNAVGNAVNNLPGQLENLYDQGMNAIGNVWNEGAQRVGNSWNNATQQLENAYNNAATAVGNAVNDASNWAGARAADVAQFGQNQINNAKSFLSRLFG